MVYEEMANAPAIGELCDAAHRGVAVHLVMTYASEWRGALTRLARCGVGVHLYHGQRYYIHAKLLIVDGRRGLVSSQNLSTGSLQYNRELGITVAGGHRADAGVRRGLRRPRLPGREHVDTIGAAVGQDRSLRRRR
jgi:phosphatidylserine/phosphatidylglycerophosphate/cardiolipin synthase-like enzyme